MKTSTKLFRYTLLSTYLPSSMKAFAVTYRELGIMRLSVLIRAIKGRGEGRKKKERKNRKKRSNPRIRFPERYIYNLYTR